MSLESAPANEEITAEFLLKKIQQIKNSEQSDTLFDEVVDFHQELLEELTSKYPDSTAEAVNLPVWQSLVSSGLPDGYAAEIPEAVENLVYERIAAFLKRFQ